MDKKRLIQNLELLGERYCDGLLKEENKIKWEANWWGGLLFYFNRSFNRGRNDRLSQKYKDFTKAVLRERYKIDEGDYEKSYNLLLQDKENGFLNWRNLQSNDLIKELKTHRTIEVDYSDFGEDPKKETVYLGNDRDIEMVLDSLNFIADFHRKNMYVYIRDSIATKGTTDTYNKLVRIRGIGDKLASFLIRDVVLANPEVIENQTIDFTHMFPVDRWVRNITEKIKGGRVTNDTKDVKQFFIDMCKNDFSPPKVAAGLWLLGIKSLDILIDNLDKIELKNQRFDV